MDTELKTLEDHLLEIIRMLTEAENYARKNEQIETGRAIARVTQNTWKRLQRIQLQIWTSTGRTPN